MNFNSKTGALSRKMLMILGSVAVVFIVGVSLLGTSNGKSTAEPTKKAESVILVGVEPVVAKPIKDILLLPGTTEARHDVTLSAERGGRVEWIGPREGDLVKKGEVIAKIDLSALQAALNRAQASYDLADKQAKRRKSLVARKVVSNEEYDKALTDLKVAQGNLSEARVNYRQGQVISPIDGVINNLTIDPGEYVKGGDPVVEIVDTSVIRINVNVPEMDVRFIKKGAVANITIDAYPGRAWQGIVDFVSFKADTGTKTFKVRVVVDNKDGVIRPGMLARTAFLRRMVPGAVTAPLFAVLDRGGERLIFVEENGVARARTVKLGVIDGDRIQILEGLKPGDNLIVTGHTTVEDGIEVRTK